MVTKIIFLKGENKMEEKTLELLLEEINGSVEALGNIDRGSDVYGIVVADTCKLLDKATAMMKLRDETSIKREEAELKEQIRIEEVERAELIRKEELEYKEKIRKEELEYKDRIRNEDVEIRKQEREEDRSEREAAKANEKESNKKNFMVECAKIAVPVLTTAALVLHDDRISKVLLKFEETGTLSTSWGRSFFGKIMKRGK